MNNRKQINQNTQEHRRAGGLWLRDQRLRSKLSQRELAEKVGAEYYTFISQLENGRGRIPPDRYKDWAKALNVSSDVFVFNLMRFYDPTTFCILFGEEGERTDKIERFEVIS